MAKLGWLSLLFCCWVSFATGQNSFEFTYGTAEDELIISAVEDFSGNVIMVGKIGSRIVGNYDPLIIKVNPSGDYLTKRIIRPDTNGYFSTINLLLDSTYLVCGVFSNSTASYDHEYLWICNIDSNFSIIHEKSYQLVDGVNYSSIVVSYSLVDNDNNIVVVGYKKYVDSELSDMCLIKLNQDGDTLLTRTPNFQFEQRFIDFFTIPGSNDFLGIVGNINLHNNGPIRFDSAFNILSIKSFYSKMFNNGTSDHWINDTTYMYSCLNIINSERDIRVYTIDTAMRFYKQLTLGKPDTSDYPAWKTSMAYANDSAVYIGGFIQKLEFYPTNPNPVEIYLIDTGLNLLGYKEYGWDANYDVWGMVATADNGCLLYGNRRTEANTTESDVFVLKVLREDFDIITAVHEADITPDRSKFWPNPVRDKMFIQLPESNLSDLELRIYQLSGREVVRKRVHGIGNVLELNIQPLACGAYVYHIVKEGVISSGKFVKVN
ncbi:MAG: T9SS type A sorting domain-containing protein [Bacteroidetes bacterium]|nr:T9SS type A sorting domain-containing protein [Bacteroidota bacterium]